MALINAVKLGTTVQSVTSWYTTSDTAAATAAKTCVIAGFTADCLLTGTTIRVKFANANTVANPTLTISNAASSPSYTSAAIAIKRYGTTAPGTNAAGSWQAGSVVSLTYDGTNFILNGWLNDNSTYSNVSLGNGYGTCTTSTGTAMAATLASYALSSMGRVSIKFSYAVPASATLNINSKGAKAIFAKGAAITAGVIKAGDIATFVYDGTQYQLVGLNVPTLSTTNVGSASGWSAGSLTTSSVAVKYVNVFTANTPTAVTTSDYTVKGVSAVTAGTAASLTTSSATIKGINVFSGGSAASLTTSSYTVKYINVFTANTPTALTVNGTTLEVTAGTAASLTTSSATIKGVNVFSGGSAASCTTSSYTIKYINVFTANTPTAVTTKDFTVKGVSAVTAGTAASLTTSSATIKYINVFTAPTLTVTSTSVVNGVTHS